MTRILLVAHEPLASALGRVAAHVFPECGAELEVLDVSASQSAESVEQSIVQRIAADPAREMLILADTFGATPCNAAMRVADGQRVRVVAGVNVPMLWRTVCYRSEGLDALVERAVAGGSQGVMRVSSARQQNQSSACGPDPNDQVQHHHQQ